MDGHPVYIHPSSAVFGHAPEWLLYHDVVLTTKEYMRTVMVVDPRWLVELAPRYYKPVETRPLSKSKKHARIEPLHDRHNPPDMWRLSKRLG
jgi:ATP-dependent RNA helicase DHX8/PRP22